MKSNEHAFQITVTQLLFTILAIVNFLLLNLPYFLYLLYYKLYDVATFLNSLYVHLAVFMNHVMLTSTNTSNDNIL